MDNSIFATDAGCKDPFADKEPLNKYMAKMVVKKAQKDRREIQAVMDGLQLLEVDIKHLPIAQESRDFVQAFCSEMREFLLGVEPEADLNHE